MLFQDIEFERELFSSANKLRGKISPSEYKYYVLPLIFLRYLSSKYEIRRNELEQLIRDESSEYYTNEDNKVIENPEEYKKVGVLYIPYTASWEYLYKNVDDIKIKSKIDDAMRLLESMHPQLKNTLSPIYEESDIPNEVISSLIKLFSKGNFELDNNKYVDLLGRIYEYFISNFASTEGNRGGEFFTPSSVVNLLVQMLEPSKGIVYDPACGTGGMFIQSKSYNFESNNLKFVGQEQNLKTIKIAKMNGILHDIILEIKQGDTLINDLYPDLKADTIISNPPFNMKDWGADYIKEDDKRLIGPINNNNANYMWIQHMLYHLKEGGLAGFVIANGALTSNSSADKEVRKHIIDNDYVDCVIQLPEKMFFGTGIPSAIIILSKNRDGINGFAKRKGEVLFIDASKKGTLLGKKQRVFSEKEISNISYIYNKYKIKNEKEYNKSGFYKKVTIDEIRENNYKLTPSLYVDIEKNKEDDIPYEEKIEYFKELIKVQFEKSNELERKIILSLEELNEKQ